ncbi:MAG TPA: hypothetical protein VF845_07745, partial [Terriglobales bacterium]
MPQRFLTDDELHDARSMMGLQFWFAPILFSLGCAGSAWATARGEAVGIVLLLLFGTITIVLWTLRLRQYRKFTADIDHRVVEVLEGAPQRTWVGGKPETAISSCQATRSKCPAIAT